MAQLKIWPFMAFSRRCQGKKKSAELFSLLSILELEGVHDEQGWSKFAKSNREHRKNIMESFNTYSYILFAVK